MRKLLEQYLDSKKLRDETRAAFDRANLDPKSEERETRLALGALEIATKEFKAAEAALHASIEQAGLPSIEVEPDGPHAAMIMSNESSLDGFVQREADRLGREVFFRYRKGSEIRKRPTSKTFEGAVVPMPEGYSSSNGL